MNSDSHRRERRARLRPTAWAASRGAAFLDSLLLSLLAFPFPLLPFPAGCRLWLVFSFFSVSFVPHCVGACLCRASRLSRPPPWGPSTRHVVCLTSLSPTCRGNLCGGPPAGLARCVWWCFTVLSRWRDHRGLPYRKWMLKKKGFSRRSSGAEGRRDPSAQPTGMGHPPTCHALLEGAAYAPAAPFGGSRSTGGGSHGH